MKTIFHKILATTALCLAAVGVSSCVRSDLGNTIDSIGKTVAKPLPSRMGRDVCSPFECTVELYRKDGQLYIDMPLVYVSERRMGIDYANPMGCPVGVLTLNTPYTTEELQKLPEVVIFTFTFGDLTFIQLIADLVGLRISLVKHHIIGIHSMHVLKVFSGVILLKNI